VNDYGVINNERLAYDYYKLLTTGRPYRNKQHNAPSSVLDWGISKNGKHKRLLVDNSGQVFFKKEVVVG
jgi:hypothetical protein